MDEGVVPTSSSRQLMVNTDSDSATTLLQHKPSRIRDSLSELTAREFLTVLVLCFVNLINYMDRFTLAGVLTFVKADFNIQDDYAGLLQTVFVIAYMVFAPIFGYLGDRYSRRMIMAFGVGLWSITTFAGSYLQQYGAFAFFRCLVGIGEASYSTIAPTIISDLFVGNLRSKMLAFFYFAIPVGSGLGYIVGSVAGAAANDWRWGLRVTPFLGAVAVALIVWVMEDPERGHAEESQIEATSYKADLKSLVKNPSFMLSTLAFTCVAFVTGALAWWGPQFIYLGLQLQPDTNVTMEMVALIFGGVTMVSGVIGVPLGSMLGSLYIKSNARAHPIICGIGLLLSAPAIGLAIIYVEASFYLPFLLIFFGELAMNLNWSLVADMLLYVVVPPRRSTAEALQILVSHMFGDAGSPYLVGLISEWLKGNSTSPDSIRVQFESLQNALFMTCFIEVLGGIFFLLAAIYIVRDRNKVDRAIAEAENATREPSHTVANEFKGEAPTTTEEYYEPQRQIFGPNTQHT